jgi:HEAT repeat protein
MSAMPGRPSAYFQFWTHFDDQAQRARGDGPRLDLLDEMTAVQRTRVEREMLHRLNLDPERDGWVVDALGALGCAEAVPQLRQLIQGPVAEDAAIALWRISRWPGAVRVLSRVIHAEPGAEDRRPPTMSRRLEAARYLAEIDSPRARQALQEIATGESAPYRLQRAVTALLV